MDNIEKQFENFISDIKHDDVPSARHRDELERNLLMASAKQSRQKRESLRIWRILMKTKIVRVAVAAVITLAVILSITLFGQFGSPAWAIEQSIEALDRFRAVSIEGWESGRTWEENGSLDLRPFKAWAVANEAQTKVEKYRHEADGVPFLITDGKQTWRYDVQTNTVHVEGRPYTASECWCGSRFLKQLEDLRSQGVFTCWQVNYDKDPTTGNQRVFLKIAWLDGRFNGPRSMQLEFDVETKLLVSLKQWENSDWEGPATLIVEKITYHEKLPDDLFQYEIPEGASLIEQ
jgi:outer membrane lipoprotein-sorting protein